MISPAYHAQVDLLLRVLPYVAQEDAFALKGGTAINLFVRDMPRFSVDIDLTYLPFDERQPALRNISEALGRIRDRLAKAIPGITVSARLQQEGQEAKLTCALPQATIKIEVNTVMRGHLWPTRSLAITQAAQDEFQKFAAIEVVSHAELFGGKTCAALDRQHPRDLFDIHQLLEHEGITEEIRLGFLASLVSHTRPMRELIRPNFLDQRHVFDSQFAGMTLRPFDYSDFEAARDRLVQELRGRLTAADRAFLLSFKAGDPDWNLFPLESLQRLPAVQWKLANIRKLKRENSKSHAQQLKALEQSLAP